MLPPRNQILAKVVPARANREPREERRPMTSPHSARSRRDSINKPHDGSLGEAETGVRCLIIGHATLLIETRQRTCRFSRTVRRYSTRTPVATQCAATRIISHTSKNQELKMSWIRENTLSFFQQLALRIVRTGQIPKHIAFIMDGNRRYADKRNVHGLEGHSRGFDKLAEVLQWCLDLGTKEVTVYAFSIENFKRSKEEVDGLMELAKEKFQRLLDERDKLMEHGVRVRVIGNLSMIPEDVRKLMAEAMLITKDNDKALLNIAFAYTSRDEVTAAVKAVVNGVKNNEITPEDISEELITTSLYTHDSPEPDLLIRSSGEVRFSDFLLWQISYACVYFAEPLWPEFSIWDLLAAIFHFQRNYDGLQAIAAENRSRHAIYNNRVVNYVNGLGTRFMHAILAAKNGSAKMVTVN